MTMHCKYCGSEHVDYLGVDDGGGDYGDSVCDQYGCLECGMVFEAHCISEDGFDDAWERFMEEDTDDLWDDDGVPFWEDES